MTDRLRLFVAVPMGAELVADLTEAVHAWRAVSGAEGLHWIDPESWHLTLAFVGSVDGDRISEVRSAVGRVAAAHGAMRRSTGGLGAFPRPARARVLWYGIDDRDGRLSRLASALRSALDLDEGPFRAHVTLARARERELDLLRLVHEADPPAGELDVGHIDLMRSHLGAGPARYETLETFRLEGAADG